MGPDWDNSIHPSLWATLLENLRHQEPGFRLLPGTSFKDDCPFVLSIVPFSLEAVGGWREEVKAEEAGSKQAEAPLDPDATPWARPLSGSSAQ